MSSSGAESDILLSVIMACRNEAGAVGRCVSEALEFMELHGIPGEVLVVDNASTDDSAALARSAGARVVYEARPGYGWAMLAGIAHARGVYGLVGDSDGEYAYSEMLPLWKHLAEGGYDFVCGDRMLSDEEEGASPFLNRHIGAPGLSLLGRLLFGTHVRDFHCGLRGFRMDRVRALGIRSTDFGFCTEMVARFARADMTVAPDVPVRKRRAFDSGRVPHLRPFRDGLRCLVLMLSLAWELRVLRRVHGRADGSR